MPKICRLTESLGKRYSSILMNEDSLYVLTYINIIITSLTRVRVTLKKN